MPPKNHDFPEEQVRRHLVEFLVGSCGVARQLIATEVPVRLNGQPQRADLVVFDRRAKPLLLAECKAPEVTLDQATLDQAARYNTILGARFLLLTNGREHFCYEHRAEGYTPLATFPTLTDLI